MAVYVLCLFLMVLWIGLRSVIVAFPGHTHLWGNNFFVFIYFVLSVCIVLPMCIPGRVAQSVMCLATDACLTADPGVTSSIPARYYTFVEIDHEIISTVILLPSADLFKKGCCQLQAKVCAQITS